MELHGMKPKKFVPKTTVTSTRGKKIVIGQGSDKPTLLVLFTTWCSSCRKAAPIISREFGQYKEKINLIGVGREHQAEELEQYAEEEGLVYDLVEDPERELFHQFAKMHVPRMYLIDTNGQVTYQDVNWHPFMLDDMIQSVQEIISK